MPSDLSTYEAEWLCRLLRKESVEAHEAAKRLRMTNPPNNLTRHAFDILSRAHDDAAKAYDRAINYHCAALAREELLRRIE